MAVATTSARADELGQQGQLILSCPLESWSTCVSGERYDDGGSHTRLTLGADVFVLPQWSAGVAVVLDDYALKGDYPYDQRYLAAEVRIGRMFKLVDRVSLWPQLGVGADETSDDIYGWAFGSTFVAGRVGVVITPLPHVMVGLAPELGLFRDQAERMSVALKSRVFVGAYF